MEQRFFGYFWVSCLSQIVQNWLLFYTVLSKNAELKMSDVPNDMERTDESWRPYWGRPSVKPCLKQTCKSNPQCLQTIINTLCDVYTLYTLYCLAFRLIPDCSSALLSMTSLQELNLAKAQASSEAHLGKQDQNFLGTGNLASDG